MGQYEKKLTFIKKEEQKDKRRNRVITRNGQKQFWFQMKWKLIGVC